MNNKCLLAFPPWPRFSCSRKQGPVAKAKSCAQAALHQAARRQLLISTSQNLSASGDASSIAPGGGCSPVLGGDFYSASGVKPTSSPGDASRFLSASCLYQCNAIHHPGWQ